MYHSLRVSPSSKKGRKPTFFIPSPSLFHFISSHLSSLFLSPPARACPQWRIIRRRRWTGLTRMFPKLETWIQHGWLEKTKKSRQNKAKKKHNKNHFEIKSRGQVWGWRRQQTKNNNEKKKKNQLDFYAIPPSPPLLLVRSIDRFGHAVISIFFLLLAMSQLPEK